MLETTLVALQEITLEKKFNDQGRKPSALRSLSQQAVLVFTLRTRLVSSLDMLEATFAALQEITLEKTFNDQGRKTLCTKIPQITTQGFACVCKGEYVFQAYHDIQNQLRHHKFQKFLKNVIFRTKKR